MNNVDTSEFTSLGLEYLNLAIEETKRMKHTYVGMVHFESAMKKMKEKYSPKIFEPYE